MITYNKKQIGNNSLSLYDKCFYKLYSLYLYIYLSVYIFFTFFPIFKYFLFIYLFKNLFIFCLLNEKNKSKF